MLPMGYSHVPMNERKQRAEELLEQVGLSQRLYHYPTMMSGGEQQRVAIARALSNSPDLIIADEPTGNLPSDKGKEIMDTLINLNREGVTIMMVTHNDDQGALAHKRIRIQDGKLAS
jgi:putative ABC transport system ATP-binding protein